MGLSVINLSIIIPHFNSSKLLEKLLSSIPNNIQIIVVDDKSDSIEIQYIEKLKEKYNFEFYHNHRIKSAGTCRNLGLEKAKGDWIIFADSDDYFMDDFYKNISKYFVTKNEVIFFKATSIYLDTKQKANRDESLNRNLENYVNRNNKKSELSLRYGISVPWCKMISKTFIMENNIRFDEVIASNDVMFSLKVGHLMKLFSISLDTIYVVTRNSGSLTSTFNKKTLDSRTKVFINKFHYLKENLNEGDFKNLGVSGLGHLIDSTQYSFIYAFEIFLLFQKNNVNLLKKEHLNIKLMFRKLLNFIKKAKSLKNYKTANKLGSENRW